MSAGDYEHAGDIPEWIAHQQEDVAEDKFDRIAGPAMMGWTCTGSHEVFKIPVPLC